MQLIIFIKICAVYKFIAISKSLIVIKHLTGSGLIWVLLILNFVSIEIVPGIMTGSGLTDNSWTWIDSLLEPQADQLNPNCYLKFI